MLFKFVSLSALLCGLALQTQGYAINIRALVSTDNRFIDTTAVNFNPDEFHSGNKRTLSEMINLVQRDMDVRAFVDLLARGGNGGGSGTGSGGHHGGAASGGTGGGRDIDAYYASPSPGHGHTHVASASQRQDTTQRERLNYIRSSKTGCFTCRDRKVKCDETKPNCARCTASQRECTFPEAAPPPKKAGAATPAGAARH